MIILSKRGLSPVVGTVLLISLAVLLGAIIFAWAQSFFNESSQKYGEPVKNFCEKIIFDAEVVQQKVYVNNKGSVPISRIEVRSNGLGGSKKIELTGGTNSPILFGETKEFTLDTTVSTDDELMIIPVLIGDNGKNKEEHICEEGFGIKTIVK